MNSGLTLETPNIDQTMLEIETAECAATERAARLWRFIAVAVAAWTYYAIYYILRGYSEAALICVTEVVVSGAFLNRFRQLEDRHKLLMHGFLTISVVGLFSLSVCRGPQLADTIYFVPCTIIIAAQLIGIWAALIWCLVSIGMVYAHFSLLFGSVHLPSDQLVNAIGFSVMVFFLCQQAEHLYEKRTRSLVELSGKLRKQSRDIQLLANTDPLTGLDNRLSLVKSLKECTRNAIQQQTKLAVFVIDMDGFKEINDALGHGIGDEVLQTIANRLRDSLPENAIVARLGGDEFCVLVPDVAGDQQGVQLAEDIIRGLRAPYRVSNEDRILDASIGICICPDMTESPDELMAYADTAMYHAKPSEQRHRLYETSMTDQIVKRLTMQERLASAMDNDEFRLVFQPQFNFESGTVSSVEALLRWTCDEVNIPPCEFIPLLESTGEISKVSCWIVDQCCRQIAKWRQQGYDIRIAINLSVLDLADGPFMQSVSDSIREHGLDGAQLEFEITESLLVEDVDGTIQKLQHLKDLGASISVDDFGTGYSSLSYLKQFPIDRLKIDRAFVRDFPNGDDGLLASTIIVLGQSLNMRVVAEGVETQRQLDFLLERGCDEYQGYLLSPPVPASECEAFFTVATNAENNHAASIG